MPAPPTPPGNEPLVHTGELIGDRYRVTGRLAGGGFGEVHRALHVGTHEEVALKILRSELLDSASAVQRFTAEARLCASLRHPNTVRVFDFGQTPGGAPYLAMELLRGQSLADAVADGGRLGPGRVLAIARQILRSLVEAHGRGVVHRDLKPGNVWLCEVMGEVDFVKVIDFGIARLLAGEVPGDLTAIGQVVGTTHYMSPEQIRGVKLDGRSDLYALGVLMYRCLAGVLPFAGPTGPAVIAAHLQDAPAPLGGHVPGLDPRLEGVVMRALEKQADDRYGSAEAMQDALAACMEVEEAGPVTATRTLGASMPPGLRAGLEPGSAETSGLHGPMAKAARSGRIVALLAVFSTAAIAVAAFWFAADVQNSAPPPLAGEPATAQPEAVVSAPAVPAAAVSATGAVSHAPAASAVVASDPKPLAVHAPPRPRAASKSNLAACAQPPGSRTWCKRCTEAADKDWCSKCRATVQQSKWCARCDAVVSTRGAWCSLCGSKASAGGPGWCACIDQIASHTDPTWCRSCLLAQPEQASDDDWCGCMKTLGRTAEPDWRCRCVISREHDRGSKAWCECHPNERILCRWRSDSAPMGRLRP